MKKIAAFFSTLCILSQCCTFNATADETDWSAAFFPSSNITAPADAPYLTYRDTYSDGTHICGQVDFYYDVSEELITLCDAVTKDSPEHFSETYGIEFNNGIHIQLDAKFDDGTWLSENGDWNALSYGEHMKADNANFLLTDLFLLDDSSKTHTFTQSNLAFMDMETESSEFLKPYVKKDTSNVNYIFAMDKHKITYRYRYYIPYCQTGSETESYLFSGWSPEASIGKDAVQPELEKPQTVEPPVLSDFSVISNDGIMCNIRCHIGISDSIYAAQRYYQAEKNQFDPFLIHAQIRIDGGDWTELYLENSTWLNNGYRSIYYTDESGKMTADSNLEVRAQLICVPMNNNASKWSQIVGIEPHQDTEETSPAETSNTDMKSTSSDTADENKVHHCQLCGICPVQPLGICLFIWVGGAILLMIVLYVAFQCLRKSKSKSQNK